MQPQLTARTGAPAVTATILACASLAVAAAASAAHRAGSEPLRHRPTAQGIHLPLFFEELPADGGTSRFLSRTPGYALTVSGNEAMLQLPRRAVSAAQGAHRRGHQVASTAGPAPTLIRMRLLGGKESAAVQGEAPQRGRVNYLVGRDPAAWRKNVATYSRVRCGNVYPGIDVVYYGTEGHLEYDLVVRPGADPGQVRLGIQGANKIHLAPNGDLVLNTPAGELRQRRPGVYQEINGARKPITADYVLHSVPGGALPEVTFRLADYDAARPLVMDPELVFSTYLGGTGNEKGGRIAVDVSNNVYVVGSTASANFPTANAIRPTFGGGNLDGDAFIAKLTPDGSQLVFATYLGGLGNDLATDVAIDGAGSIYVTGGTGSADFPTRNPVQAAKLGTEDAFVAKLDSEGSELLYATYLGGDGADEGEAITVDGGRNAYVTGTTLSANFPTLTPIQATFGGISDAFVTRLNASGTAVLFSTYLGGTSDDAAEAIAVDSAGAICLTGVTYSSNFPVYLARQSTLRGAADAFVTRLNPGGLTFSYSTFLGGSDFDEGTDLVVDSRRIVYVAGTTSSQDFPTANAFQQDIGGLDDAFVCKINSIGTTLLYSTFLGGTGVESGNGLAVDASGAIYLTGQTTSDDFPVEPAASSSRTGVSDAFVTKIRADGTGLVYSTYFGGGGGEAGTSIAVDAFGGAYVLGNTSSPDFPTHAPFQAAAGGGFDAFVTKLDGGTPAPAFPINLKATVITEAQVTLTWEDSATNATAFKLERKTGTEAYAELPLELGPSARTASDTTVAPATSYSYRVRATNAGGDSDYSNELKVSTASLATGTLSVAAKVNFGQILTGRFKKKTLFIYNLNRNKNLRVTLTAPAAPFVLAPNTPTTFVIGARSKRGISISFSPTVAGAAHGILALTSSDPRHPAVNVKLNGSGKQAHGTQ